MVRLGIFRFLLLCTFFLAPEMACSIVDSDYSGTEGNNAKDGIVKGGLKDSASSVDGTYTDGMDPEAGCGLVTLLNGSPLSVN